MQQKIKIAAAVLLVLSLTIVSCKKTDTSTLNTDNTDLSLQADDQARVSNENDALLNDANGAIETSGSAFTGTSQSDLEPVPTGTSGVQGVIGSTCDASFVLDTLNNNKRLTITYNGANCYGNRTRTGVVTISTPLGTHFKDANAVVTISIANLKITRKADGKSITINGTETITNVSGGLLINLPTLGTITHKIESPGLSITFDDGSQRTWMIARQRQFSYNNGIVITSTGTHTDGNVTGIAEWGTTRFGKTFVTSITQPMVIRQDCNFRLVSGQVTHQRLVATVVVTFGLDSSGNPTTCPGSGVYYYKAVWTLPNGIVKTYILPY